jgi:hypothetical protein
MKSQIQIFFENLLLSILTVGKVLILSNPFLRYSRIKTDSDTCVILGNGPSLNSTLEENPSFFKNKILFCVNIFARTQNYELLKPSFYIITSPEFWNKDDKIGWYEDRFKTFESIVDKTKWDLYLIIPRLARNDKEWIKFMKIYLTGTDHNWIQEIHVTRNNEVLISQKHFYDRQFQDREDKNSPHPRPMYLGNTKNERKLHEVLIKFYYTFKGYWDLKEYACKKNVDIVNLTANSYIDAFKKEDI